MAAGQKSAEPPKCVVCAQPAKTLKCVKCKTRYCSVQCQTVDWKERDHRKECRRRVKATGGGASREPPKPKAAPPLVDGPARGRFDVARARAVAAAAIPATAPEPEPEHWLGASRCPVCLEDWDVNTLTIPHPLCCSKAICSPCSEKLRSERSPCPLCRTPIPKSNEEALAMLRQNKANKNPAAIRELAGYIAKGRLGLTPSQKKAARLYQRAADLGDVQAMYNLGCAYLKGDGVKVDTGKTVKYFRMAADRGNARAQHNLGNLFYDGIGVDRDFAESYRYYKLAAEQGLARAEYNAGYMHAKGDGVAQDTTKAIFWYERAEAQGNEKARSTLLAVRGHLQRLLDKPG